VQPLENESKAIDAKKVATPQRARTIRHLLHRHSARRSGRYQRTNARPSIHRWLDIPLGESAHNSDMSKPLEATATEDKCHTGTVRLLPRATHAALRFPLHSTLRSFVCTL
jgi:hypothetical protein